MKIVEHDPPKRPVQIDVPGFDVGPDDTVVDVGCGSGEACVYAAAQGARVIGLEIDPDCLAQSDSAMQGVFQGSWQGILSNCNPIPLPAQLATVVICTEVLEHVDNPVQLVRELVRIGQPNARYLITVPDPASETLMRQVAPSWYWLPPYHRRIFSHDQLNTLLTDAGLQIVLRRQGGFYSTLWWALRMASGNAVPYASAPESNLAPQWEALWKDLLAQEQGQRLAAALDDTIPKSQVVLARKSNENTPRLKRLRRAAPSRSYWVQRLKEGVVRIGGYDVHWRIRRAKAG